jgi:hypothetical protein
MGVLDDVSVADVRTACAYFAGDGRPDKSFALLREATSGVIDLALVEHRNALFEWVEAWGCRIRRPLPGEPTPFQQSLAEWWPLWRRDAPPSDAQLTDLSDAQIDLIANAYSDLRARPAALGARPRSVAATAAAKVMHALRPLAIVPWDANIAKRLYRANGPSAFAAHQRACAALAQRLLVEARCTASELPAVVGRPGESIAKVIDEYCYVRISRTS